MASVIDGNDVQELYSLLRQSAWEDAAKHFETELSGNERALPEARLAYAIALIRTNREAKGLELIDGEVLRLPDTRAHLRRYAISPLVAAGSLELAGKLLDRVIAANSGPIEDLRLRASVRGRLKQWPGALEDARAVLDERPDDPSAQRAYIQTLLRAGQVEDAGAEAAKLLDSAAADLKLANIALLALTRSGRTEEAAELALEMAEADIEDEAMAAVIVRTLFETGRHDETIEVGERLLEEGWEHEVLRSSVAHAYLQSQRDDRYDRAIEHLREGLEVAPDDVRMNMAMGEALLRTRNYSAALPHLKAACDLQPKGAHQRALYARALKQVGRYSEAADEFRTLLSLQPSSPRWARYAAGALSQAGRRKEAVELFDQFVGDRKASLPRNFDKGLKALWDKLDSVNVPQARLDWARSLRNGPAMDRLEWERRAKWGHLADHYMLDWLECRDDRIPDVMLRLADLSDAERVLGGIDRSRGMILASAHIGPMYAGPLALELLGVRSRWLASTPSVARTAYASSLISTSEQDDMSVGKAFMRSLRQGYSVVIAIDGAINLAAPRIPFEGQEITYSSFAARTAYSMSVPSVFAAPRWEGERIGFVIRQLPDPEPDETIEEHAERWKAAYLAELRDFLGGEPENLRLSGGLWRHIR
jgi:tetratricopeptide (TPR) repeat protein